MAIVSGIDVCVSICVSEGSHAHGNMWQGCHSRVVNLVAVTSGLGMWTSANPSRCGFVCCLCDAVCYCILLHTWFMQSGTGQSEPKEITSLVRRSAIAPTNGKALELRANKLCVDSFCGYWIVFPMFMWKQGDGALLYVMGKSVPLSVNLVNRN